jgi:hypothetical protein
MTIGFSNRVQSWLHNIRLCSSNLISYDQPRGGGGTAPSATVGRRTYKLSVLPCETVSTFIVPLCASPSTTIEGPEPMR